MLGYIAINNCPGLDHIVKFISLTITILVTNTITTSFATDVDKKFHHPQQFIKKLKQSKNPGKKVYQAFCANCHNANPLIPVGAPKFRHEDDWRARLVKSNEFIFKNVDSGIGIMPARGGCFECSDSDLKAAIQYMLPQIKKKK